MTQAQAAEQAQPIRVAVFADFVCPYSYLAVDQINRLAREYGVEPLWRPHWLHPDTPPEGQPRERSADAEASAERRAAWMKEMAPEQFSRIRYPGKRQYSFRAFEALEFAYDCGLDFPFITALYDLMWTQGGDIGETETLLTAAERAGLDSAGLKVALDQNQYAQRAFDAVTQARELGIMNTPTIFLGRTRINGWTYYEVLQ
ncbi:MAG: DsbA family oxidoreductase, partial [Burkholderiales bacterium]